MINVRKYQSQDKRALVALWKCIFPDDPTHNEPSRVLDEKLAVDDLIFIAEDNGRIVGACMAGYDGHRGWLYAVAVLPDYRRKRIGTQLIDLAMQALKSRGCIKVNLQIEIDQGDGIQQRGLRSFYLRKSDKGYQLLPSDIQF